MWGWGWGANGRQRGLGKRELPLCDIDGLPAGNGPMLPIGFLDLLYIDFNAIAYAPSGAGVNCRLWTQKVN